MPRRLRLIAFASVLVTALVVRAQAPAEPELPLPENYFPELKIMLETAARESPRVLTRNLDEAVAEGNRIIAHAGQLPSVGGSFGYLPWDRDYRLSDPRSPYTSQKITYSFNVTQPVYHWGALESTARIGELQRKITRGETIEAYRQLANEIRGQFLQLIIKKAGLARTRGNQHQAEEQLRRAQENLGRHAIAEADMFGPTLAVEQAQLATDRAQDDYDSSRLLLGKFIGAGPVPDEQVPEAIPELKPEPDRLQALLDKFASQKASQSYLLRTLHDQIEIEKLNYRVAGARLRPSFDVLVGTSKDEQSYTANIGSKYGVTSYYAGIQVNWSIFDGRATKGIKLNTLARRRELERRYRQVTQDLLDQAQSKFRQLQFAGRNLDIVKRQLAHSEGDVAQMKDRVARGLASAADLRSAEFGRSGVLIDIYTARADYLSRAADFLGIVLTDPVRPNPAENSP